MIRRISGCVSVGRKVLSGSHLRNVSAVGGTRFEPGADVPSTNPQSSTRRAFSFSQPLAKLDNNDTPSHLHRKKNTGRRDRKVNHDALLRRTKHLIRETTADESSASADDCYNTLEAWIQIAEQRREISAAHNAAKLLSALEANVHRHRRTVLLPKTSYYNVVLQAYAVSDGKRQAAESAEAILDRMLSLCRGYGELGPENRAIQPCEPNIKSWNIVVNCWARSGDTDAGTRAELILHKMEAWKDYCDTRRQTTKEFPYQGCPISERTITGILDAWSRSQHRDAPDNATKLLYRVVESHRNQENLFTNVKLDAAVFNSCIAAWSRSGRGRDAATKAEGLLRLMTTLSETSELNYSISPSTTTYVLVLSAWAKCEEKEGTGDAAHRAELILHNMIRLYQQGSPIKPTVLTFTNCITAWARCRLSDAPERAELLLRRLIRLFEETGDLDFKPDTYCGNAVVSAWARAYHRPDSVEQAFMALRRMTRFCTIDLDGYSALLDALQKKGMADKSLKLLETIEGAGARDSRMLPRVNEYNSVLSALARSGRPKQAEELLAKMDTMAARQGRSSTSPDKFSFTIVIDAWARNPDPSSFAGASRVLEEMLTRYRAGDIKVKPDHFTFSVVMKACLRTQSSDEDKQHSLDKALEVFRAIEFGKPDHVGYSAILLVIRKQACDLSLRRSLLASVFEECKAAGMVSQGVVDAVRQSDAFALHSLDAAWSKHVPRKEWP